jgi:hypothetical protein
MRTTPVRAYVVVAETKKPGEPATLHATKMLNLTINLIMIRNEFDNIRFLPP